MKILTFKEWMKSEECYELATDFNSQLEYEASDFDYAEAYEEYKSQMKYTEEKVYTERYMMDNGYETDVFTNFGRKVLNQTVKMLNEHLTMTAGRAIIMPSNKDGECTVIFITPQQVGGNNISVHTRPIKEVKKDCWSIIPIFQE